MTGVSRERLAASLTATLPPLVIATHTLAELMRNWFAPDAPHIAPAIALGVIGSAGLAMVAHRALESTRNTVAMSVGLSLLATILLRWLEPESLVSSLAIVICAPVGTWVGIKISERLTTALDGAVRRAPIRSILWLLLALLAVVQITRLSSHVSDPDSEWWITTKHPFFAQHQCINAYVHAADLNRQGVENVYDRKYYPGINPQAEPQATVDGLTPDDPYQYPPQFLLLPRLALAFTNSFHLIAVSWFAIQSFLFLFVAWWLVRAVSGKRAYMAALMAPAVWISFPLLSNLQYGQFHLASIALAVLGMLLFQSKRYSLGGAALAAAVVSKLAPGILLVYLLAQRRWKEIGWTAVFVGVYTALSLWVIGYDQFYYFVTYQLPRLQDGTAFSFADAWPDYINLIIAGNQSPYGIILKLGALGLPGMSIVVARGFHLLYTVAVGVVAVLAARRIPGRISQPLIWLALLNLASIVSKGAWGDYVALGSVWLLSFLTIEIGTNRRATIMLTGAWLFTALALGILPSPVLSDGVTMIALSGIGAAIVVALNTWVIFRRTPEVSPELARIRSDLS